MRQIPVALSSANVVSNLRHSDPRLADPAIADWRIDMANRSYSVSEDYGDDSKVYEYLPDDTEEEQWNYVQHYQIGDLLRTIRDLEKYNAELRKELGDARARGQKAFALRSRRVS